jgi:Ca-activated chloride channel family protein
MNLLWPSALILLSLLPVTAVIYWLMLRRRRRYAVRYSSLALIREALPAQSRIRRHIPVALFLLALASLVFALARPITVAIVPAGRATVILAMDVSRSMIQTDIPPSRLAAAKAAALTFIERQQVNNQIGLVAFAGYAQMILMPTTESEELEKAIQGLTTGRGTAIGSGILTALDTLAEVNPQVALSDRGNAQDIDVTPVPEGEYVSDIIVLLTDGVNTTGAEPIAAAQQAVDRGVRVYTIGFGTEMGSMGRSDGFFSGRFRHGIDEETLKRVAEMTGGEYYAAESAGELEDVFQSLPTHLVTKEETTEISVVFAALGALLVILAVILSQLWNPLP